MATNRRLQYVQFFGGCSKAEVSGGNLECTESVEQRQCVFHIYSFNE